MASATTRAEARRIAGYEVGERIAVGGHSEVFAARRTSDGRDVVLKVPWPELARDPAFRSSIAHEAALAKTLAHPGIVEVLDTLELDGAPTLVLERVDGCTLGELLEALRGRGEALSTGAAVGLASLLLDGLAHLHEAKDEHGRPLGAVHRDVTPRNVLVSRGGDVKLVDLGIARSRLRTERTRTGLVRGTPRYLSPEQATGSDVDARTDVYGVGLLLFEMLSGAPYLEGEGELELLRRAEEPPPRSLDASHPAGLRAALERALARFPEERFPSARAFARALAPFAAPDVRDELAARVQSVSLAAATSRNASGDAGATKATPATPPGRAPAIRRVAGLGSALVASALVASALVLGARTRAPAPSEPTPASARTSPRIADRASGSVPRPETPSAPAAEAVAPPASRSGTPPRAPPRATNGGARTTEPLDPSPVAAAAPIPIASRATSPSPPETPPPAAPSEMRTEAPPIDRATVERQLARANAALRDARARGRDTARLDPLATAALEAFAEGDYPTANQRLERLLAALASP